MTAKSDLTEVIIGEVLLGYCAIPWTVTAFDPVTREATLVLGYPGYLHASLTDPWVAPEAAWYRLVRVTDDEKTVPNRHVPPSQRDLSAHAPGCNCMGCFYRSDRGRIDPWIAAAIVLGAISYVLLTIVLSRG